MQQSQQNQEINPDVVCQKTIQAKLNTYQAREGFESVLKQYNDAVNTLIELVGLMKARIIELETEKKVKPEPEPGPKPEPKNETGPNKTKPVVGK